jgi:hypothetical protein
MKIRALCIVLLSYILCGSCEKQKKYDLFPLREGNEFYYKYYKYRMYSTVEGTESWKVISESVLGSSVEYIIERKLNGIIKILNDTITISDSTRYLEVIEDQSSFLISVFGFSFIRYQDIDMIELKHEGNTSIPESSYVFKADSGMTYYYYYHPPNQVERESLCLDSIKISQ